MDNKYRRDIQLQDWSRVVFSFVHLELTSSCVFRKGRSSLRIERDSSFQQGFDICSFDERIDRDIGIEGEIPNKDRITRIDIATVEMLADVEIRSVQIENFVPNKNIQRRTGTFVVGMSTKFVVVIVILLVVVIVGTRQGQSHRQDRWRTAGRSIGLRIVITGWTGERKWRGIRIETWREIVLDVYRTLSEGHSLRCDRRGHGLARIGARGEGLAARRLRADENLVLSIFDDHRVAIQLKTIASIQRPLGFFTGGKSNETIAFAYFDTLDHMSIGMKDRLKMCTGGLSR